MGRAGSTTGCLQAAVLAFSVCLLACALYGATEEYGVIATRKLLVSEHHLTDGKEALKHNLEFLAVELFSLAAAEVIDVSVEGSL